MGNRFIEVLSGRDKHLSSPPPVEQNEAACATPEQAEQTVPEDSAANEALAESPVAVEAGAVKENAQVSAWQLVLPGYEFTDGSLRAKTSPAARNAANGAVQTEGEKGAALPPIRARRSLVFGLSAGGLIALLGVHLGDVLSEREPPRAMVMASTQAPCPQAQVAAISPVVASSSLPLLLSPLVDASAAPVDVAPPAEEVSGTSVPVAEVASDEDEAVAPPVTWKAKPKPTVKARSRIEMEVRDVMVSGRAVAAVIMLKRTGSKQGRVRVRWKTLPGTATPAKDYQGASKTVQFADGQAQRTIFVPILQQPPGGESRTFSVVLERAPRGSPLGSVTSTTVTIRGDG